MPQWIGVVHVFAHYARGRTWDFAGATPQGPNKRGAGWGAESIALSGDGTIIAVAERGSNALSVTPGAGSGGIAVCARSGRVVFYAREEFGVYELKTTAALDTGNSQRCGLFGAAISLSHDGTQLAVLENDLDTGNRSAARVHVYQSSQAIWKASSTVEIAREVDAPSRAFGTLSLSADAHTFALGDASWRKGLGGTALVYTRNGAEWAQAKSYHLGAPEQDDAFGVAVSLSANGKTLAVGAPHEDGRIGGIGGDELNDKAENSGAAYVYER